MVASLRARPRRIDLGALDDAALIGAIARRDDRALGELYDRFGGVAYATALRVLRDRGLAEDAVAEGLLAVWRSAARFDVARGSARSWVLLLVHRRAVDLVRQNERRHRDLEHRELPLAASAEDTATLNAERRRVQDAVATLPARQRTALELAYFGGYTHLEIAARLGIPLGTVKSRLFGGLKRLAELMVEPAPVD